MRARAAFRWWRCVFTCLLLTFVAPAPAAAQQDEIGWHVEAAPSATTSARAVGGAPASAVGDAREVGASFASLPARPTAAVLYLLNCSLLR